MLKINIYITLLLIISCIQTTNSFAVSPKSYIETVVFSDIEINNNVVFVVDELDAKFTIFVNQKTLNIKYIKPLELINGEVVVYNILGKEVTRKKLENSNLNQVSLPSHNTCYIIRINYSGKVFTQKVIVTSLD